MPKHPRTSSRILKNPQKSSNILKHSQKSSRIFKNPQTSSNILKNPRESPRIPGNNNQTTCDPAAPVPLPCRSRAAPRCDTHTHTKIRTDPYLQNQETCSTGYSEPMLEADARGGCSRRMLEADSS